jgi:hypothetical protein
VKGPSRTARSAPSARFRRLLGVAGVLPILTLGVVDCYSTGDGTPPPTNQFYFPVGLQVSNGGTVLYAVNSDFDLQYNGGTLQAYDLRLIREHAARIIANPRDPEVPLARPSDATDNPCTGDPPVYRDDGSGLRQPLGETCAPPVRSDFYVRSSAVLGAFATDLVLSLPPAELVPQAPSHVDVPVGTRAFDRLFVPVRGNASVTWASVPRDTPDSVDPGRFAIVCGQGGDGRCDKSHQAGVDRNERGNTRHITMPGEPFGIAMSEDGESLVVTHQSDTKTSLFATGLSRTQNGTTVDDADPPSLSFVLDGVPFGGVGVTAVPHDRDAFDPAEPFPRPAFLETTRAAPEVDLLRRYPDSAAGVGNDDGSSLRRPFLDREAAFPILPSAGGTDSRGIVIDPTPRLACKAAVTGVDPAKGRTQADVDADLQACARKPARVFIANRTPASLLVGTVGGIGADGVTYDPDALSLHDEIPLSAGPSRLYLAPIVDRDGALALRVFAVCFDSATIFIYDPDSFQLENVVRVAPGPFAMAFDPFTLEDVALHKQVPLDPREPVERPLRRYRFAYVASFTQSYVQLLDLDDAQADRSTFERVVFTLGQPTNPKGT